MFFKVFSCIEDGAVELGCFLVLLLADVRISEGLRQVFFEGCKSILRHEAVGVK